MFTDDAMASRKSLKEKMLASQKSTKTINQLSYWACILTELRTIDFSVEADYKRGMDILGSLNSSSRTDNTILSIPDDDDVDNDFMMSPWYSIFTSMKLFEMNDFDDSNSIEKSLKKLKVLFKIQEELKLMKEKRSNNTEP